LLLSCCLVYTARTRREHGLYTYGPVYELRICNILANYCDYTRKQSKAPYCLSPEVSTKYGDGIWDKDSLFTDGPYLVYTHTRTHTLTPDRLLYTRTTKWSVKIFTAILAQLDNLRVATSVVDRDVTGFRTAPSSEKTCHYVFVSNSAELEANVEWHLFADTAIITVNITVVCYYCKLLNR